MGRLHVERPPLSQEKNTMKIEIELDEDKVFQAVVERNLAT